MAFDSGYAIAWLDAHIGMEDNCRSMKKEFAVGVVETAAVPPLPPDPLNDLLCTVHEYGDPIQFTNTQEGALELIKNYLKIEKKVILISSASMGRKIVPKIEQEKLKVQSYYIFCRDIDAHRDWLIECTNDGLDMLMFNHQTNLLIRLCRDMSKMLIKDGKAFLDAKKPKTALQYFQFAEALAEKAVTYDKPLSESDTYRPSTDHRPILAALIKKAKQAMEEESTTE